VNTIQKELLLKQIKKYIKVEESQEQSVLDYFLLRSFAKKELLLQAGKISRHENFVIEGCLRVFIVDNSGVEHNISFSPESWWAGDLSSFLKTEPASYNIEALETSKVLQISRDSWDDLFLKFPDMEHYFRLMFQNTVIALQSRIVQNISYTAEECYLNFLKNYPQLNLRVSQKHIASYLGITPEFLSMLRRKLTPK
jgi:CRP-like cAMP-binding protein